MAVGQAVGEQVVEHAAVVAAHQAVLSAALGDPAHVVGQHPLQERERVWPPGLHLPHVGHVEHPNVAANADVLLADPGVLDRHLPAGERDELCACGSVTLVQSGPAQ